MSKHNGWSARTTDGSRRDWDRVVVVVVAAVCVAGQVQLSARVLGAPMLIASFSSTFALVYGAADRRSAIGRGIGVHAVCAAAAVAACAVECVPPAGFIAGVASFSVITAAILRHPQPQA